jgi:hypothetical protein
VETMSITAYAASRSADRQSIRRAIAAGVIQLVDGRVDPAQADASWGVARRASRLGQYQHDAAGTRSAKAKVAVALGRLRLLKTRLDTLRDQYVDRAEAVAAGEREAEYVIQSLRAAPAAYAPTLAAEMDIPPETAVRILDRFIGLTLVEIGDLVRQARRDAERA